DDLLRSIRQGEFLRLFSKTGKRAAGAVFIGRAAVVVAELNEHEIAALEVTEHGVPEAFGLEGPAAASRAGTIDDVSFCGVEVIGEGRAPAEALAVAGRGITDDEQARLRLRGERRRENHGSEAGGGSGHF